MRLLGIVFAGLLASCAHAGQTEPVATGCDSIVQTDLVACIEQRAETSQARLAGTYAELKQRLPDQQARQLERGQGQWGRFQLTYCQSVYDEIHPGREASIEKLACMQQLSDDRADELNRMQANEQFPVFAQALRALGRAGYPRDDVIERLAASYTSDDFGWDEYLRSHCELTQLRFGEPTQACRARVNFLRSY